MILFSVEIKMLNYNWDIEKRKKLSYYWGLSQNDLDVPDDAHSSGITFLL